MNLDRYDIISGSSRTVYKFTSKGPKGEIDKFVIYTETDVPGIYNLGLGDANPLTQKIDDQTVSNNSDRPKVLATVAATVIAFFEQYPEAEVVAEGNTKSKKWLYRKSVERYISEIEGDFDVKGLFNQQWIPFAKDIDFEAISIIRKRVNL